jgi:serine/threonine protein kinase
MISKLLQKAYAQTEYDAAETIREIDPGQEFSIYPARICELGEDHIFADGPENEYHKCKIIVDRTATNLAANKDDYRVIHMIDGGTEISRIRFNMAQEVIAMFASFLPLMRGIAKMHSYRYYHLDIKPANIVTQLNGSGEHVFHTRLIDFGFATRGEEFIVSHSTVPHKKSYAVWPFEMRWLTLRSLREYIDDFRTSQQRVSEEIVRFYEKSVLSAVASGPTNIYYDLHGAARGTLAEYGRHIWDAGMKMKQSGGEAILYELLGKVDVYSFGQVLARMYVSILGHYRLHDGRIYMKLRGQDIAVDDLSSESTSALYEKELCAIVSVPFYKLLDGMMNIDPAQRLTMEAAAKAYEGWVAVMKRSAGIGRRVDRLLAKRVKQDIPYIGDLFPDAETPAAVAAPALPASPPADPRREHEFISVSPSLSPVVRGQRRAAARFSPQEENTYIHIEGGSHKHLRALGHLKPARTRRRRSRATSESK